MSRFTNSNTFTMDDDEQVAPADVEAVEVAEETPIGELKKQFAAAEQQRKTAEAQLQLMRDKVALEQAFAAEEARAKEIKSKYSEAMNDYRYDDAADLNLELQDAHANKKQVASAYQEIGRREQAAKPALAPDDFEAALQGMDPRVQDWARRNKQDVLDPARQRVAFAADALAQAKGYSPGTDEYLDFLDDSMGYGAEAPAPEPKRRSSPGSTRRGPAAPPSRTSSSGGGGRTKVFLTADDRRQAQNYGVSDAEYAKWKIAAERDTAAGGDEASGFHRNKMLSFKAVAS